MPERKPIHDKFLGNTFPPLVTITWSCLTCRRKKTIQAAEAYIKWGMYTRVGDVVKLLTEKCDREDSKGNSLCNVLPESTKVLER